MTISIYDSLTQQKKILNVRTQGHLSLYVCGPTVYSDPHLGHAKNYLSYDLLIRYFQYLGYKTFYVQNITDVGHLLGDSNEGEDRILKKAREANTEPMAIAELYTYKFFEAMDLLGLQRPNISPRATGHIPEQIELVEELIEKGFAYEVDGTVYFDVTKEPTYGQLSNRQLEDMLSGTRVESREEKRNPQDFALWKRAEPEHLMRWRDPWSGWGYPGWHTECVVMSLKYLGEDFDIHGGGMDLKFPHHEAEIAQVQAVGKKFARYWVHGNLLTIEGQKMSKSLGNYVPLDEAIAQYGALALRYFMVSCHYRSILDYSSNALEGAKNSVQNLHQTVRSLRKRLPENIQAPQKHFQEIKTSFCNAMDDDLNTPQALAALFELRREVNIALQSQEPNLEALADANELFNQLGGEVLGLIPQEIVPVVVEDQKVESLMELMLRLRAQLREAKNYEQADALRDQLLSLGISLKDSPQGTHWEWKES